MKREELEGLLQQTKAQMDKQASILLADSNNRQAREKYDDLKKLWFSVNKEIREQNFGEQPINPRLEQQRKLDMIEQSYNLEEEMVGIADNLAQTDGGRRELEYVLPGYKTPMEQLVETARERPEELVDAAATAIDNRQEAVVLGAKKLIHLAKPVLDVLSAGVYATAGAVDEALKPGATPYKIGKRSVREFFEPLLPGDQGGERMYFGDVFEKVPYIGENLTLALPTPFGLVDPVTIPAEQVPGYEPFGRKTVSDLAPGAFAEAEPTFTGELEKAGGNYGEAAKQFVIEKFKPIKGGMLDWSVRGTAGTAADVFIDPTTYIGFGGAAAAGRVVTREGEKLLTKKGIRELGKAADEIGRVAENGTRILPGNNTVFWKKAIDEAVDELDIKELDTLADDLGINTNIYNQTPEQLALIGANEKALGPAKKIKDSLVIIEDYRKRVKEAALVKGIDKIKSPGASFILEEKIAGFAGEKVVKASADTPGLVHKGLAIRWFDFNLDLDPVSFAKKATDYAMDVIKAELPANHLEIFNRTRTILHHAAITPVVQALEILRGNFTRLKSNDKFFKRLYENHIFATAARHTQNTMEIKELWEKYAGKVDYRKVTEFLQKQRATLASSLAGETVDIYTGALKLSEAESELAAQLRKRLDYQRALEQRFRVRRNPKAVLPGTDTKAVPLPTDVDLLIPIKTPKDQLIQNIDILFYGRRHSRKGSKYISGQVVWGMPDFEEELIKSGIVEVNGRLLIDPRALAIIEKYQPAFTKTLGFKESVLEVVDNWGEQLFQHLTDSTNRIALNAFENTVMTKFGAKSGARLPAHVAEELGRSSVDPKTFERIRDHIQTVQIKNYSSIPGGAETKLVKTQGTKTVEEIGNILSGKPQNIQKEYIRQMMVRFSGNEDAFMEALGLAYRFDAMPDVIKNIDLFARDRMLPFRGILLPKEIIWDLKNMKPKTLGMLEPFLQQWDRAVGAFKTYHTVVDKSFHFRNAATGVLFNILDNGINFWRSYPQTFTIMKSLGIKPPTGKAFDGINGLLEKEIAKVNALEATITTATGRVYTLAEIREGLIKHGVVKGDLVEAGKTITEAVSGPVGLKDLPLPKDATLGEKVPRVGKNVAKGAGRAIYELTPVVFGGIPPALGQRIGGAVESWERIAITINALRRGEDFAQAAATANRFMVDYSNLGRAEKFAKRFGFPFVTYFRNIIPVTITEILKRPGQAVIPNKILQPLRDGDADDFMPTWAQDDGTFIKLNTNNYEIEVITGFETPLTIFNTFNPLANKIRDDYGRIGLLGVVTGTISGSRDTALAFLGPGPKVIANAIAGEGDLDTRNPDAVAALLDAIGMGSMKNKLFTIKKDTAGHTRHFFKDNAYSHFVAIAQAWMLGRVLNNTDKFIETAELDPITKIKLVDSLIQGWTTSESYTGLKRKSLPQTQDQARLSPDYIRKLREIKRQLREAQVREGMANEITLYKESQD